MTPKALVCILAGMLLFGLSGHAEAQNASVQSVGTGDFGNVVSAATGTTVLRADPASGSVIKVSGSGASLSSSGARSLVTIYCGNQPACANADTLVTVTNTGTPTGRAGTLGNFTVSTSGTATTINSVTSTGNPLIFVIAAFGRKNSTDLWLGFDIPIYGNDSSGATGSASSGFLVTSSRLSGAGANSLAAAATARVFRPVAISNTVPLAFGRISRPNSGTGTVSLAAATSAVTVSGTGVKALSAVTASAAAFSITGEGGQSLTVSVPSSFTLSGATGSITVTTNPSLTGVQVLTGALGAAGTLPLKVGGSFTLSPTTPAESYSGSFSVTVQYN